MEIAIRLPTDVSIALRRFAREVRESEKDAAELALREYLISVGALELHDERQARRT